MAECLFDFVPEYRLFSADLATAIVYQPPVAAPLSPEATERTPYVHNVADNSYLPLVTHGNVQTGAKFGETMRIFAATDDLSHVLFRSFAQLTSSSVGSDGSRLYEWSDGILQLVSLLPDGKSCQKVFIGDGGRYQTGVQALSSDGRWVVWGCGVEAPGPLYVRDTVEGRTIEISSAATFQAASRDGSQVFFIERGSLYDFDVKQDKAVAVAQTVGGKENAAVQAQVVASEDGSRVYFVARSVLANGGQPGADNLYTSRLEADGWDTQYVATLSSEDSHSWSSAGAGTSDGVDLAFVSSRVSPNGTIFHIHVGAFPNGL